MQNVVCCNHARMRSSAGKATQSRRTQQCAAVKALKPLATVYCGRVSHGRLSVGCEARYACFCPGGMHQSVCGCEA
jgi:hypothetical protein